MEKNVIEMIQNKIGEMMSDPKYVAMLLGIAISRLPDGLEVARDDYDVLNGKGLVLTGGSCPGTFKLILKPLEGDVARTPGVTDAGEE
jgi:hypothetical protein